MIRLANISNGLIYPHDMVCYFQSQHGHKCKLGYFRIDSMPYDVVIHLLQGGDITVIDGTSHNRLPDAIKFGLTTWTIVFNRAGHDYTTRVAPWQTMEMTKSAHSNLHRRYVSSIRKLIKYYGWSGGIKMGDNERVKLEIHKNIIYDDKPELIQMGIKTGGIHEGSKIISQTHNIYSRL